MKSKFWLIVGAIVGVFIALAMGLPGDRSKAPSLATPAPLTTPTRIGNVAPRQPVTPSATRLVEDEHELDEDSEVTDGGSPTPSSSSGPTVGRFGPVGGSGVVVLSSPSGNDSDNGQPSPQIDVRSIFEPLDERSLSGSGFNPGVRVGGGGGGASVEPDPEPEPQLTPEGSNLPWVSGQARGYTALYTMHPRARSVVEQHIRALLESHVREPYIGMLVDGTFSKDYAYARSVITRLSTNGRRLTLGLYLTNGATQRQWQSTSIEGTFNLIDPVRFRDLIRRDRFTRSQFQQVVDEARQLFAFNTQEYPNNRNVAVVMLEDNLERGSYSAMRRIAQGGFGTTVNFVRNPCVGCYRGNDGDTQGDAREEHALGLFSTLRRGDAYSLDGEGFTYPGENTGDKVSYPQTLDLMRQAYSRELQYIGLWRHGWQGLIPGAPRDHPDERTFVATTDAQLKFDIDLLRAGLPVEEESFD